ncbi:GDSL-type esterase/lipase family protein [Paenibacillus sp. FSL E2-0230]|uniref:GDSL-type esterase/lipase family protein n=1 Tax=Paenibacillus sp. FSL E2-0230 TaxID=2954727 RepID=UPI0030D04326
MIGKKIITLTTIALLICAVMLNLPTISKADGTNLALSATASTTSNGGQAATSNVNDGSNSTGLVSTDNPSFPQYVTLNWSTGQAFNAVTLSTNYAQGQGPTNWDIQLSADGSTNWTTVASSGTIAWTTNGFAESKQLTFTPVTHMKGVRIKINSANLSWSHYAVTEIEVVDTSIASPIKVAAVGDSITYGLGASNQPATSYPAQLQSLLGPGYVVNNYGVSGRTMLKKGDYPYWNEQVYSDSKNWLPDIVIIQLGTNDSKSENWQYKNEFISNYVEMINSYKNLPSHPKIYVALSPTVYPGVWGVYDSVVSGEVVPLTIQAAKQAGVPVIDNNTVTQNMIDNFPDHLHPNDSGYQVLAGNIYNSLTNLALGKPALASGSAIGQGPELAFDGSTESDWVVPGETSWLQIDLGSLQPIGRYVVKHAGSYEFWATQSLNTRDFKLQVSNDGSSWTDADTVAGNTADITERNVSASGRYVRLYIVNPQTETSYRGARIYELGIWANPVQISP